MPSSDRRLRVPPAERLASAENRIDLTRQLAALRSEPHGARPGSRQITVFRKGQVSLVLFAMDAGGRLASHHAPAFVVIHVLRGTVRVGAPMATHELTAGEILVLEPDASHDVESVTDSDLLVTLSLVRHAPAPHG